MLVTFLPLYLSDNEFIELENSLYLSGKHDVSGEARDAHGRWTAGGGGATKQKTLFKHGPNATRSQIIMGKAKRQLAKAKRSDVHTGRYIEKSTRKTRNRAATHLRIAKGHISHAVRTAKVHSARKAGPTIRKYAKKAHGHLSKAAYYLKNQGRAASIHARKAVYHAGKAARKHGRAAAIHAGRALHHTKLSVKHHAKHIEQFAKRHGRIAALQSGRALHRSKIGVGKTLKYAKNAVNSAGNYARKTIRKFRPAKLKQAMLFGYEN